MGKPNHRDRSDIIRDIAIMKNNIRILREQYLLRINEVEDELIDFEKELAAANPDTKEGKQ